MNPRRQATPGTAGCILVLVLIAPACRQRNTGPAPDVQQRTAGPPDAGPAKPVIDDKSGLFFSFFNRRAALQTVERLGQIMPEARSQVMVIDPSRPLPDDRIFVADLRQRDTSGRYPVWIEKRGAWLDRNMPRHSVVEPLKPKPRARRRRRGRHRRRGAPSAVARAGPDAGSPAAGLAEQPAAPSGPAPRVVMFSTSWCPSCKAARQYFARRGIDYADLDVEKDSNAARQYMAIQQRFRIKRGVVPLIIVNGRLFQGFSEPQIEAALKAPPPG